MSSVRDLRHIGFLYNDCVSAAAALMKDIGRGTCVDLSSFWCMTLKENT